MDIKLYKVGGCVRDELLGRAYKDIDYAVEAPSYVDMVKYIVDSGGKIHLSNPEYFTVRAKLNQEDADFVLCRRDGEYKDGRHPEDVRPGSIFDDLSRRDFTINAMAEDAAGVIIDPFMGQRDIQLRMIRCVGDTSTRMDEDRIRILRAIRFSVTLGFYVHDDIIDFMKSLPYLHALRGVSTERIREELHKMFKHDSNRALFWLAEFPNLTKEIFDTDIWLMPTTKE